MRQRSDSSSRGSRNEDWSRGEIYARSPSSYERGSNTMRKARSPQRREESYSSKRRSNNRSRSSQNRNQKRSGQSRSRSQLYKQGMSSAHLQVPLPKLPPSVPGFKIKNMKGEEESTDEEGILKAVSRITKDSQMDREEEAFQKRLEKLKNNIYVELNVANHGQNSNEKKILEDSKSNSSFEEEGNMKNTEDEDIKDSVKNVALKHEVNELKREFSKLKEAIKSLKDESATKKKDTSESDSSGAEDAKTINAVDIISREVRTTILSKTKTKTKATYLIIKAERKKNLLKSKLIELRNEKKKMKEKVTKTSYSSQFRQKAKHGEDLNSDPEDSDMEGKSLMEAIKQRLEKKMRDNNRKYGEGSKGKRRHKAKQYRAREYSMETQEMGGRVRRREKERVKKGGNN